MDIKSNATLTTAAAAGNDDGTNWMGCKHAMTVNIKMYWWCHKLALHPYLTIYGSYEEEVP